MKIDWLNIGSLVFILLVNLAVGLIIFKAAQGNRKLDFFWAHVMWTLTWLAWLFAWFTWYLGWSPIIVDLLDDAGAIFLIGLCVVYMYGREGLKSYGTGLATLFQLIGVFLMIVSQVVDWKPSSDIPLLQQIMNRTLLFGISLCLATFALVLVGWTFIQYFGQWQWSTPFALLAVIYAVFQVHVFQETLFTPPGIMMPSCWRIAFVSWRMGFALTYGVLIMESASIPVPFATI